jgi:curved DNA-binding protein CbpA
MPASGPDPYEVLGVSPGASDADVRAAYRRLVQLHHPDHNGGSPAATRRFEEVQAAYAEIRAQREKAPRARQSRPRPTADPDLDARLADLERRVREARARSDRAMRAARAETRARFKRPSDEELGYVHTDDSLRKILADARSELSDRLGGAGEHPVGKRVADLIDELAAKLTGDTKSDQRD